MTLKDDMVLRCKIGIPHILTNLVTFTRNFKRKINLNFFSYPSPKNTESLYYIFYQSSMITFKKIFLRTRNPTRVALKYTCHPPNPTPISIKTLNSPCKTPTNQIIFESHKPFSKEIKSPLQFSIDQNSKPNNGVSRSEIPNRRSQRPGGGENRPNVR